MSSHINFHIPRDVYREGVVARIYHCSLQVSLNTLATCNSFESLTQPLSLRLRVRKATCGCLHKVPIRVLDFLSSLVVSTDQVIKVGNFNIHMDNT